jgi:hypothetical protein
MAGKTPPEIEAKWQGGSFSFKAIGELAVILTVALVAVFGVVALTNWERIFG